MKVEDFDHAFPYRFPLKHFFDRNAFNVRSLYAMRFADCLFQFLNVGHAVAASTSSPTLQKDFSTPAAMAGVQRSVLCRNTRL